MAGCILVDEGLVTLLAAVNLGLFPKIRFIDVTANRITEKSLPAIVKFIVENKGSPLTIEMKHQLMHGKKLKDFK